MGYKKLKNSLLNKILKIDNISFAYHLCNGFGLEVGAMSKPFKFNKNVTVEYADIFEENKLKTIAQNVPIKNLYNKKYPPIKHILKKPKFLLDSVKDNTYDFIYSSHVLEHTPNLYSAILDQLKKIKKNGLIYAVLPNKKYTFDCDRKNTDPNYLVKKHLNNDFSFTLEEALDVVKNTKDHPLYKGIKNIEEYAKKMIDEPLGIHHFYVFSEKNILELLGHITRNSNSDLIYFSTLKNTKYNDIHFVLKKN